MFCNANFRGYSGAGGTSEEFEAVFNVQKNKLAKLGLDSTTYRLALDVVEACLQESPTDRCVCCLLRLKSILQNFIDLI